MGKCLLRTHWQEMWLGTRTAGIVGCDGLDRSCGLVHVTYAWRCCVVLFRTKKSLSLLPSSTYLLGTQTLCLQLTSLHSVLRLASGWHMKKLWQRPELNRIVFRPKTTLGIVGNIVRNTGLGPCFTYRAELKSETSWNWLVKPVQTGLSMRPFGTIELGMVTLYMYRTNPIMGRIDANNYNTIGLPRQTEGDLLV